MAITLTPQLASEYQKLFDTCVINRYPEVDRSLQIILAGKERYEAVSAKTKVPWYFIGIVHNLECGSKFTTHLHNGDPLRARTVQVPKGRPKDGEAPFTWEVSAIDALTLKSLDKWTDWSISGLLFQLERYNGFGYRVKGINTPYLWSFSNHYISGKYTADGIYNENAVSKQCGAAVLLRRMSERQIAVIGELDKITQIKNLGREVVFAPKKYSAKAEQLQKLLNEVGLPLRIDGYAGRMTSDALYAVTKKYLLNDK
jgi:lysozyme family protein